MISHVILFSMEEEHTKHVTYKIASHFVWCPMYRKPILVGDMAQFVESEIRRLCEENQWAIGALNVQGDDVMSDERDPPLELQTLVEQLGAGDWRMALEAETALARAGQAGIEAGLWGLAHPNARVRRGGAGLLGHHRTDAGFAAPPWTGLHQPAPPVPSLAVPSCCLPPRH